MACKNAKTHLNLADNPKHKTRFNQLLKTAEKAFKKLHQNGNYKPTDLFKNTEYQALANGTTELFTTAIPHETSQEMRTYLEQDVFIFSQLKTHTQLSEARQYLKDNNGNIRSYGQFEQDVLKLNKKYNKNYLEAEYEFAVQSSQSASNWANLQENTERYWLEYRTAGDERVRQAHQVLSGVCLPKDDAFWTEFYPPNGWRCRCVAVEVLAREKTKSDNKKAIEQGKKATTNINKNGKNKLEMFRFNPGQNKKVFPPKNSYTKVVGADVVKKASEKNIKEKQFIPKNISKYEDKLSIKIDKTIFELLKKETVLMFNNPKGIRANGAFYSPSLNIVKIPIDERRKVSKWYAKAVVYHEFGHAVDAQLGLKKNPELKKLMAKHRKTIDFKKVDERVVKFQEYAIRKKNRDLSEKVGAIRDTIMALNPKYGFGHSVAYFEQEGNKEAEFIAHAFENAFSGNDLFKKVMPELYSEMVKWVKNIKK